MAILSMEDQSRLVRQLEEEFRAILTLAQRNDENLEPRSARWMEDIQNIIRLCYFDEATLHALKEWIREIQYMTSHHACSMHAA